MVKRLSLVFISLSLVLLSCGKSNNAAGRTGTITGYVYLSDTIPAPGVHVYAKSAPQYGGYTNGNGFFSVDVPEGQEIIVIDGGLFKKELTVELSEGEVKELYPNSHPLVLRDSTNYKIAVMMGEFDSIEAIFDQIGIKRITGPDDTASGYIVYHPDDFPRDLETLKKFNLLAFNCGPQGPGINAATLKDYMEEGGNIYASDWQYWVLDSLSLKDHKVFLYDDNGDYATGSRGEIRAEVVDSILRFQLGKDSVTVNFDHDGWVIIDSVTLDIDVLLRGKVSELGDKPAPLAIMAVPFNNGGMLLYTSFHYEAQSTNEDMLNILRMYLLRIGQH